MNKATDLIVSVDVNLRNDYLKIEKNILEKSISDMILQRG